MKATAVKGGTIKLNQKYQGSEITATLQANTSSRLRALVNSLKKYAKEHEMDIIKVLSFEKDPDGGWKAIVEAHNWNPMNWVGNPYSTDPLNWDEDEVKMSQGIETWSKARKAPPEGGYWLNPSTGKYEPSPIK